MDLVEAIRLLALAEVVNQRRAPADRRELDPDYPLRSVLRRYSEQFHTPLHIVHALDLEFVLQNYFESDFEKLEQKELMSIVEDAVTEPEELKEMQLQEDISDADSFLMLKEIAAEEAAKRASKVATSLTEVSKTIDSLSRLGREPSLVVDGPKDKSSEISMSFAEEGEIDLEGDNFGMLSTPKSTK